MVCTPQPPLIDVVLSGSPSLPGLSFSTTRYCSAASQSLPRSFSPSPLGPLFSPSKAFSDAKRTRASSDTHPVHRHTAAKTDTEKDAVKTHAHTQDAQTHTHTQSESLKGCLILSGLSSLYHPEPILLSDCTDTIQKKKVQFILKKRFTIRQSSKFKFE